MPQRQADRDDARVGARVRQQREHAELSPGQLAKQVGLTRQQITNYELGKSRAPGTTLARIAKVLGVSIAAFFEG